MGWIRRKMATVQQPQSEGEKKFDEAMAEANDLLIRTRSVKAQLEPFRHADDPFSAIEKSHSFDGFYQ